jgi:signal-transduction protein with cAMP-binding, CBS, and nucleotidyltransferase domain
MVLVAKDITEKDILSLPRNTTALEAAEQMKLNRHGFVVVVASDGSLEGIVTEWDYLSKLVAEGKDPAKVSLEDLMTVNIVTVKPDDGFDYVAQLMAEKGIRRVLVLQGGKVVGAITARTVLSRMKEYVDRISSQIARLQAPRL